MSTMEQMSEEGTQGTAREKERQLSKTHVQLSSRGLTSMVALRRFTNVKVLYLQNNKIAQMSSLSHLPLLTQICLQNNEITKIEGLQCQRDLRQLHLSENRITRLEGLEACAQLEELFIDNQKQDDNNEEFSFSEDSILTVAFSLHTLHLEGAGVKSLFWLQHLIALQELDVSDNRIEELSAIEPVLKGCPSLRKMWMARNPICTGPAGGSLPSGSSRHWQQRVRDFVVCTASVSLEELEGKPLCANQRRYLRSLGAMKAKGARLREKEKGTTDRSAMIRTTAGSVEASSSFPSNGKTPLELQRTGNLSDSGARASVQSSDTSGKKGKGVGGVQGSSGGARLCEKGTQGPTPLSAHALSNDGSTSPSMPTSARIAAPENGDDHLPAVLSAAVTVREVESAAGRSASAVSSARSVSRSTATGAAMKMSSSDRRWIQQESLRSALQRRGSMFVGQQN